MKKKQHVVVRETASFDIDPQRGFSPLCPDELPVNDALAIVPELNAQAIKAKYRLASKDAHNPEGTWIATAKEPQFSLVGTENVDIKWNRHCQVGTGGFEFLPGLPKPLEYDFVAYKGIEADSHPYGACYHDLANTRSTGVIDFLELRGVQTVIVGGLATDYCVKTTALQLAKAGFEVIVNLAACRAIDFDGSLYSALAEMTAAGVSFVENSDEIEVVV